ncbi:MAG: glutamate synthase, partial [Atopobium sp.]|nr:glutamate synthase [Atopobium sp.]
GSIEGFPGVFSGGDCKSGPSTVIKAIEAGKVAAANIDHSLGCDHKVTLNVELPSLKIKGLRQCGRCEMKERESSERVHDWNLVEIGLTEEEAHQEASRCLRCDHFGYGAFRGGRNHQW